MEKGRRETTMSLVDEAAAIQVLAEYERVMKDWDVQYTPEATVADVACVLLKSRYVQDAVRETKTAPQAL
jgi:hypothetical protein